ncbi:unnamed protein product [Angiostrongylus costaricensis]|uniref:MSP domain-containing protein n=1 Tax=Angiostrongylus costaricensis TaxID=334426 RepID=A0A0R3PGZ3_ANGCS|nr:unnamed protein product [Angiostrongylus costaricensis]
MLDVKEATLMAVSCHSFEYAREDTNNNRIVVEWCNTPEGPAKQYRREWLKGDGISAERIFLWSTTLEDD